MTPWSDIAGLQLLPAQEYAHFANLIFGEEGRQIYPAESD